MLFPTLCLITGCDDDEGQQNFSATIVGHWHTISVTSTRVNTATGSVVEYSNEQKTIDAKMYDDGTCNMNNSMGTYKLIGNDLDIYLPNPNNQNTVELHHYTIEELTAKRMILINVEYIDSREKGALVTWKVTYKYQLGKE